MPTPLTTFEIRRSKDGTISGTLPAGALPYGQPLMISAVDPDTAVNTFVIADGKCDGFLTRASAVGSGLTTDEHFFGIYRDDTIETPFEAGHAGSIDDAQYVTEIEAEGASYLKLSSTGLLSGSTAADTEISFDVGLFYVAQTGDVVQYKVRAQMTPKVAGQVRIRFYKTRSYTK